MHAKTKPSTIFPNNNLSSPTFLTQNSTDIATPSLTSPFSAGEKFLSPIVPATPDRKLSKPDIIYISKSELEKELHNFVNTLIEQKAVNQNEITHHLEHLKKQVVNLNNENSRLLASPNTTQLEGDSHPNSSRDQRIEELEAQKQSSEDRIRDHSLYIQRLEKKVNELVNQCQGLMRINHEMSSQILQMSQLPPSGEPQFEELSQKLQQITEENHELSEENNRLRELVVRFESARSQDSRNTMDHLRVDTQIKGLGDLARKPEIRRDQVKSISFRGDSPPDSAITDKQGLKSEVENLKETIESLRAQLKDSQAEASQSAKLQEENKRLREELERPTIGDVDVSIHLKEGHKSLREVIKEPLDMPSTQDVGHKTSRTETTKVTSPELLRKQLGDYKSANVILQKKAEKYLLQIEDLNGALKQANENLDALQNKYITLEKELVNKNKLESILNTHINLMKKLEIKIHTLTEENVLLQQANEENLVVITELKSQLEEAAPRIHDAESGTKFTTPPRSGRRSSDSRPSYLSPCRSPDTIALEREIINKKYDEKVKKVYHEHDMTIRAERIKHKNQIEKYNMNLDVLSRKIQALVAVNEDLGKEFEMLKVEFTNYRTLSWSVLQEIQKYLENCKKYDEVIEKSILDITAGNNSDLKAQDLRFAYERLKGDILNINDVIEDRKRYM